MEWVLSITAILLLLPIYTQLKLYRMTKSTSYLYLAMVFAAVLSNRIVSVIPLTEKAEMMVFDTLFILIHFPLTMVANLYLERDEDKSLKLTSAGFLLLWLLLLSMSTIDADTYWVKSYGRLALALYLLYAVTSLKRVVSTPRVKTVGVLLLIASFLLVANGGIYFLTAYTREEIQAFSDLVVFGVSAILFVLALFFPEAMLVTKMQLAGAVQLYDLIEKTERERPSFGIPVTTLLEYLSTFARENSPRSEDSTKEDSL